MVLKVLKTKVMILNAVIFTLYSVLGYDIRFTLLELSLSWISWLELHLMIIFIIDSSANYFTTNQLIKSN